MLRLPLNEAVAALAMVVERGDLVCQREDELGHDRSDPQLTSEVHNSS